MKAPSFRRLPLFVRGIPILREILDLKEETPISLQIEKPPRFIGLYLAQEGKDNSRPEKWPKGDAVRHACAIESANAPPFWVPQASLQEGEYRLA